MNSIFAWMIITEYFVVAKMKTPANKWLIRILINLHKSFPDLRVFIADNVG